MPEWILALLRWAAGVPSPDQLAEQYAGTSPGARGDVPAPTCTGCGDVADRHRFGRCPGGDEDDRWTPAHADPYGEGLRCAH